MKTHKNFMIVTLIVLLIIVIKDGKHVNADCLGCPPTATKVAISFQDATTLTGYLIVHHAKTDDVIDQQRIEPEYFPQYSPNATEQQNASDGKAFLYLKGTTEVPAPVKGHAFYEPELSERSYTRLYKEEYQGIRDISFGQDSIILIGTPVTFSISSIVGIERLSETYWDVWYLSEADEKYLQQEPQSAFEYKDEFDGRIMCFYYFQKVTLEYLVQEVDLQSILNDNEEGEEEGEDEKDGVICFDRGGLT